MRLSVTMRDIQILRGWANKRIMQALAYLIIQFNCKQWLIQFKLKQEPTRFYVWFLDLPPSPFAYLSTIQCKSRIRHHTPFRLGSNSLDKRGWCLECPTHEIYFHLPSLLVLDCSGFVLVWSQPQSSVPMPHALLPAFFSHNQATRIRLAVPATFRRCHIFLRPLQTCTAHSVRLQLNFQKWTPSSARQMRYFCRFPTK